MRSVLLRLLGAASAFALVAACVGDIGPSPGQGDVSGVAPAGGTGAGAGSGGTADPPATCKVSPASALVFDGVDDEVSMGAAPALGLAAFTIEAWIRRDGYGQAAPSGTFSVVPIAGKGSCKNDPATVDCNYTLGLRGDVLFADFEQVGDGTNHPIVGKTVVTWGEWHHVAATYDGTWRLYVDGKLDTEAAVNADPRADTPQYFAIGTAFDSANKPEGRFHGAIGEVRVWDHARSGDEISGAMFDAIATAEGLAARFSLGEEDQGKDSAGASDGEVVGAAIDPDGPPVGEGFLPAILAAGPEDGASVGGASVELAADVSDPDGDPMKVSFYVREVTEQDDFTIVVLPDTQYYTDVSRNTAHFFYEQTGWIAANREARNIALVIHNGDIVEHGNRDDGAWVRTDTAMKKIEGALDGLPNGLPYAMCAGNHDQTPLGTPGGTASYNDWFGLGRFQSREYFGGHYGGNMDENWVTFNVGGLYFVVVNLQYRVDSDPAVLAWMRSVLEANPRTFGIVNSHYILGKTAGWSKQGAAFYEGLKDVESARLMTCGHVCVDGDGESKRTDEFEGHVIHSMLGDYQCFGYGPPPAGGGEGYMRVWSFSPKKGELHVQTYSPSLDEWRTGRDAEYTLAVDLKGAGAPREKLAAVDPVAGKATTTFTGLEKGKTYEWSATVRDCTHAAQTEIRRFTVP